MEVQQLYAHYSMNKDSLLLILATQLQLQLLKEYLKELILSTSQTIKKNLIELNKRVELL